jgi:hypothetical protein
MKISVRGNKSKTAFSSARDRFRCQRFASGQVRCQPSRVFDLDVFSEFFEVEWSGWMYA